jgi:diguanylate cyclase (GGDEF)-like protein
MDGITLLVVGCFVAALAGLLLLAAWAEMRRAPALLWWATGHLINGAAAASLSLGLATQTTPVLIAGGGGIAASMAIYYGGVRVFADRLPSPWVMAGAAAVWALTTLPFVPGNPRTSIAVAFLLATALLALASVELWRTRYERLAARWALVAVFLLHAGFMGVGGLGLLAGWLTADATPALLSWFDLILFERLIFLIAGALFMVLIVRERHELMSATAADVDALTGVATRGAFFVRAERIRRRTQADGGLVSLIVFDLDHFKAINDTHGHPVGDRVLRAFADCAMAVLRPGDLVGRIGGEEFVALLPAAGSEVAYVVADRIRHAFEKTPKTIDNGAVDATVSAGVACATTDMSLEALFEAADQALYRAKALGRNRVERAGAVVAAPHSEVMRVA